MKGEFEAFFATRSPKNYKFSLLETVARNFNSLFTMNSGCTPGAVLGYHTKDQSPEFLARGLTSNAIMLA